MTHPDDLPVDADDEEADLDPSEVSAERTSHANEADLIDQAIVVPVVDDDADR